jgi:multiple sugar transport system ATP-binding protein
VEETAAMLGLTPLLEKRPRQLSGGERQRVALGRAIIRKPQLFLFDEPLSNLDAVLRAQMRRELKRLHVQLGTTFIYVTHDQEEALSLSDRIAILRDGRIQQCGTPRELYDEPANRFVASFFGSPPMNFLEGQLIIEEDKAWLKVSNQRAPLSTIPLPVEEVEMGIRPEHIRVSREPLENAWPTRVALVEPHGGQMHVELEMDGVRLTALGSVEKEFRAGEQVWAQVPPSRVHWFGAGGVRLHTTPTDRKSQETP